VWFDGFTPAGKLFKVDAKTRKITGYQPPTAGLPRRIQAAPDGIIWFAEFGAGKIGRFDPKTETFREYPLPGAEPTPYALGIARDGNVWFSSEQMDFIGCLDPKTGKVTQYPFPHSENAMREFLPDSQGRMWYGSAPNNKVGYFYLASGK
jgi:virginiamycin B lyase